MRHLASAGAQRSRDDRGTTRRALHSPNRFGAAWVAAFLGVVLIIAVLFWAITALP